MKLSGRVALVTGALGGIGRGAALALAEEGADVALHDILKVEAAQEALAKVKTLGRRCLYHPADISDQDAVEALVRRVVAEFGRVDILVSAAVWSERQPFLEADMAGFRRTLEVSMMGPFYALRAVARQMVEQSPRSLGAGHGSPVNQTVRGSRGSIIIVGSPLAYIPAPNCMAYCMAKAANDQMARAAALELLPHRIRVNIMHPGWTDTPGERKFYTEEQLREIAPRLPWGRLARPEEMARGIVFLASDDADYVTASTLTMDGGINLPWGRYI